MSERRPPADDAPPKDTPPIDPPRKQAPVQEPPGREAPRPQAPPPDESGKPKPHERVEKLRLGVRVVWWSAVILAVVFGGLALWLGLAKGDPFALFYAVLAVCCALAGYGTLIAVRRPSAS